MLKKSMRWIFVASLLVLMVGVSYGQEGYTTGAASQATINVVNPMSLQSNVFLCGGKHQAGTPIAGNGTATSNGTTGTITISGIPVTASVFRATLFWTVLTEDTAATLPGSTTGESIIFNGAPVTGTNIGKALATPCFPQSATIAYKADVKAHVSSPGNGAYLLSGFPGGSNFSEGATLQILWTDPNGPLVEDVLYHTNTGGLLAVTKGDPFSQALTGYTANAAGPVSATLYEVIGNGQNNAGETLRFDGPAPGEINLDNTLDGSTVAHAPNTCHSTIGTQCYWDDDFWNVSSQMTNSATTASLNLSPSSDCFDFDALNLSVSTDVAQVCAAGGAVVDKMCPTTANYKNHGAYVSCVAHATETFLASQGLPEGGTCPVEEISSCIVSARAKTDVGK